MRFLCTYVEMGACLYPNRSHLTYSVLQCNIPDIKRHFDTNKNLLSGLMLTDEALHFIGQTR